MITAVSGTKLLCTNTKCVDSYSGMGAWLVMETVMLMFKHLDWGLDLWVWLTQNLR